jgi:Flp pilus assembly protein TadG
LPFAAVNSQHQSNINYPKSLPIRVLPKGVTSQGLRPVKIRFKYSSILRTGRALAADLIFGLRRELPRFTADKRGNVAMIFAIASIPILFAVGAAIDYTSATRRKAKLDAIADAVALSTVTQSGNPPAFSPVPGQGLTQAEAQTRAQTLFNSLAGTVGGVSNFTGTVSVIDNPSAQTSPRTTTVTYTAQSNDAFGQIIGMNTIGIGNTSSPTVAEVAAAPNINFYILADSSPSMAIPATTAGIDAMYTATWCSQQFTPLVPSKSGSTINLLQQTAGQTLSASVAATCPSSTYKAGAVQYSSSTKTLVPYSADNGSGCSFACHESDQSSWVLPGTTAYPGTGTASNPGFVDNYTYAENILGLTLRIDNLRNAIEQLGPYATTISQGSGGNAGNGATYQMAVATFDTDWTPCTNGNSPLHFISGGSSMTPQSMSTASSAAANIQMLQMFSNGNLTGTDSTSTSKVTISSKQYSLTSISPSTSCSNNDGTKAIDAAMSKINSIMPTPGNGTNASGDTPQQVLMLITDGVNDTYVPSSGTMSSSSNSTGGGVPGFGSTPGRNISLIDTTICNTIKQRISSSGLPIRIAVLYLDYSNLDTTVSGLPSSATTNSFYTSYVQPFDDNTSPTPNPNIETALQSCASSPALFGKVSTDQDIGAALQQLFLNATATVHLAQ